MSVTLHTSAGDLKIEVFCESVPKTAEVRETLGQPIKLSAPRLTMLHHRTSSRSAPQTTTMNPHSTG